MNRKIVLFISSLNAFELINYLVTNNLLACVLIANKKDMNVHNLIQVLIQYKIPYFVDHKDDIKNIESLKKINADFALSFGFSTKISKSIIEFFKGKIFNIHASPLPTYRGENPLFWQLKNGETKSALCIQKLTQNINQGDIIIKKEFDINYQDTYGTLNGFISHFIVNMINEFLEKLDSKKLNALAQIGEKSYVKEVKKEDIVIDWKNMNSFDIYNLCRACNPIFGGAKTIWNNSEISILEMTIVDRDNLGLEAGTIIYIGSPDGLIISTIDGCVRVDVISVPEGVFSGLRFAKRFKIDAGEKLKKTKGYIMTGDGSELIGSIGMFGGTFVVKNYAFCDGQVISINQYQALFSIIGAYYGGDGRTNFGIPDLRGRVATGLDRNSPTVNPSYSFQLGQMGGMDTFVMDISQMPQHDHSFNYASSNSSDDVTCTGSLNIASDGDDASSATSGSYLSAGPIKAGNFSVNNFYKNNATTFKSLNVDINCSGGGGFNPDLASIGVNGGTTAIRLHQPYTVINYEIALVGLYPSRN